MNADDDVKSDLLTYLQRGRDVLLFKLDVPAYRAAGLVIYIFLGCTAVGGVAFFSRRFRRWLRIDRLLEVLPGAPGRILRKVDRAFFSCREHRGALLIAFITESPPNVNDKWPAYGAPAGHRRYVIVSQPQLNVKRLPVG